MKQKILIYQRKQMTNIMRNKNYKVGDKVEYYYFAKGGYHYGHGFVKKVIKNLFSAKYVIQLYRETDVHACDANQIITKVKPKTED